MTSKEFRGQMESTHLSRTFSDQGVRLRLRKEQRTITGYVRLPTRICVYLHELDQREDTKVLRSNLQRLLSHTTCNLERYTIEAGTAARRSELGRTVITVPKCPTRLNLGQTVRCTNIQFSRTLVTLHKGLQRPNPNLMGGC